MKSDSVPALHLKTKVAEIIESKSKAELVIDLLAALEEPSITSKLRGIHALTKAIVHIIRRGDLNVHEGEETDKYKIWVNEVFDQSWNKLLTLISHEDKRLSELALSTSIRFLVTKHEASTSDNRGMLT